MPKILLVEDDNNLREIFEMRLQAEGYQTVTAGNGEEGLTVAMQQKPDLIICDVMMPKLSGFEMLETLRSAPEGKNTKVIMMTALGQAEDRARGEKLGVIKYLVKSQATLEDFARTVREVLPPGEGDTNAPVTQQAAEQNNQKESENKMPDDPTTPTTSPAPAGDPMTPPAAPDSGSMPAPAGDPMAGQQTEAQEENVVQNQVNSFASAPAPAGDPMTPPAAPDSGSMPAPASDSMGGSNPMDSAAPAAPAAGPMDAGSIPVATPPADNPAPAGDSTTPPAAPTDPASGSI